MSAFSSLTLTAIAVWVLATISSPVLAVDWQKIGSNPIIDINSNQPFTSSQYLYPLSGFIDYDDEGDSLGIFIPLYYGIGPVDTAIAYDYGRGFEYYPTGLPSPTAYPYLTRLSTLASGDRFYVFYQNVGDPNHLWAVSMDFYGESIKQFNAWSPPVLVYTAPNDYIENISVTSLNNQTIVIAVKHDSDNTVDLIFTNDFITFYPAGQVTPDNSFAAVQVYDGFSIFAAHDPSNPAGPEILWFHWIDQNLNTPYLSYFTSQYQPPVLKTPFIQTGNAQIINGGGVTAAVNKDGSKVLMVRATPQSITSSFMLYYSIFNIDTQSFIQAETQVVGVDGSIAQTFTMPAIISSRYAGNVIKGTGQQVALTWSNYADNLVYAFTGSPF